METIEVNPAQKDIPRGRSFFSIEQSHEGRFAGAGRADKKGKFAHSDMQINIYQCGPTAIVLIDVLQSNHKLNQRFSSPQARDLSGHGCH